MRSFRAGVPGDWLCGAFVRGSPRGPGQATLGTDCAELLCAGGGGLRTRHSRGARWAGAGR
eukprot:1186685-Prorocentrum_minimum.AAC.2